MNLLSEIEFEELLLTQYINDKADIIVNNLNNKINVVDNNIYVLQEYIKISY